ncbi:MAG: DUF1080 domain-containing protein, partial [Pseudomonadota bacterium]
MKRRSFMAATAATTLLAAPRGPALAQAAGLTPLFNGRDLTGWDLVGNANWRVEEGAMVSDRGNGFLVTPRDYRDFHLRVEFYYEASTNSGIFIRCTNPTTISTANAYEVNIWDERPEPRYGTGAIVDLAAVDPMPRAPGRWSV